MHVDLTESQQKIYIQLEKSINSSFDRSKYVLTGDIGIGKTLIAKKIAESLNGRYICFTSEYGENFIKSIDYASIEANDFLSYVQSEIIKDEEKDLILIDNIEFIFNKLFEKDKIEKFLKSYDRMPSKKKIVLVIPGYCITYFNLNRKNLFSFEFKNSDKEKLAEIYKISKIESQDYTNGYYFK
ncbi:MAG TPA: ATP-binding protein [Candidatus Paceibacterota bacterium]